MLSRPLLYIIYIIRTDQDTSRDVPGDGPVRSQTWREDACLSAPLVLFARSVDGATDGPCATVVLDAERSLCGRDFVWGRRRYGSPGVLPGPRWPRRKCEGRNYRCGVSVIAVIIVMIAVIIVIVVVAALVTSAMLVVAWRGKEAAGQEARSGQDEQTASQDFRKPLRFRHDGLLAPLVCPWGCFRWVGASMVDAAFGRAKGP